MKNVKQFILCSFLLSGCTAWPNYGSGGMDEEYGYQRLSILEQPTLVVDPLQRRLAQEIDDLKKEIERAWASDAGKYNPAAMALIETQWGRVAREYAGQMYADAEVDIKRLKVMLQTLKNELQRREQKALEIPVTASLETSHESS